MSPRTPILNSHPPPHTRHTTTTTTSSPNTNNNNPPHVTIGVRTWLGDFMALPAYMGPATAITMNGVFGNLPDPRAALLKATTLLPPGGHVLLSHPMGRAWHAALRQQTPELVPHPLPDEDQLRTLIADLPLRLLALRDEPDLYVALLQVRAVTHTP